MLTLLTTSVTVYGSMYLLDIELNIGTTLVTFLVVGVVDYAVHLLSRIKMLVQKGIEIDEAILAAMQGVGRSTVVNVVIFSMGFVALLFSAYKPVIDLGVLVILALSSSGFMTILLVTLISPWFFASIVPQPAVQEGEQPRVGCARLNRRGACVLKTARGAMAVQGRRSGFSGLFPGVRTGIASEHL